MSKSRRGRVGWEMERARKRGSKGQVGKFSRTGLREVAVSLSAGMRMGRGGGVQIGGEPVEESVEP